MERTIDWDEGAVVTIDQRALPGACRTLRLTGVGELVDAITSLAVRGAPALGAAGALGVALSAHRHTGPGGLDRAAVREDAARIAAARPTAVNLAGGVERALGALPGGAAAVLAEARRLLDEDERINRSASRRAADLARLLGPGRPLRIHTHCNTGRLATVAWGTALGTIRELAAAGDLAEVIADETRPLLQGARLTAWELAEDGIPFRVCADSAGPWAIASGLVDAVVVGADRIAANGDTANKIGTYALAVAAHRSGVPFLVVAPESTIDPATATGADIEIEERDGAEVTCYAGHAVAPPGTRAYNPAFDVTPAELITAVVTERRVLVGGVERPAHEPTGSPS
ncbi:S-methyl-5-thioribose-1-phosphate isomerase [Streptomyces sp. CA-111067]|uniref:S-methyl-5-thioribose-1-phosphate isomerase n=1 Tax=Streptomyces sp. CA-111067 TaxID=3240046 RepID=UPI003D95911C